MTLDQLMALCISEDHAAQLRVWDATAGREWERSPERLRQAMTAGEVALDSPLVRLVTVKAYEAAGGTVRRDLFSDQDDGYIIDVPLLRRLAGERLERTAAKVKEEGWRWTEARLECQYHDHRVTTALDVQARGCDGELARFGDEGIEQCAAWQDLAQLRETWGERIPGDPARLLPWLIALPPNELCDLLAVCAALTVNAVTSTSCDHPADEVAAAVALDMADWWEPTAASYLCQVPKAAILEAIGEAVSPEAAAPLAKLKKDELVARAEALMDGKRWLPAVLRPRSKTEEPQRASLRVVASRVRALLR